MDPTAVDGAFVLLRIIWHLCFVAKTSKTLQVNLTPHCFVTSCCTYGCCAGYAHVIILGGNDVSHALMAYDRYSLGGPDYVDPVAFHDVFDVINGTAQLTFEPVITVGALRRCIIHYNISSFLYD